MNRIIVRSRIGDDGVLHLDIPVGTADAGRPVQVQIDAEPISTPHQDYHDFLDSTAGAWQGDFERPEPGDFEVRDPLS